MLPAVLVLLQVLTLAALIFFLYLIVQQQGRILLRLDRMEEQIARAAVAALNDPDSIQPGTALSPFTLAGLDGRSKTLAGFAGRKLLLVHWSTGCGFCASIARDLDLLVEPLKRNNVQLLLISVGDEKSHREQIRLRSLLDALLLAKSPGELPLFFQGTGTPVAFLADEQGRAGRPLAEGAPEVMNLARELAGETARDAAKKPLPGNRPISESRIERNGLPAGSAAPDFRLPDLDQNTVSLKDYRGKQLILIFSDPQCGPCEELARRLARWERLPEGVELLLVGRGDVDVNRQKARQLGLRHRMVVQKQWELSRRFGIFATPVAFLIDDHGVIEREVASGVDAICELISSVPEGSFAAGGQRVST